MRKCKSFKRTITNILVVALILPVWVLGSPIFQKPETARAATSSIQNFDDSESAPNFTKNNNLNWDTETDGNLRNSQTTNGNYAGEWARWKFHASDTGRYMVMVSWLASADRAEDATYSLLDSALVAKSDLAGVDSFIVDQTKDASGNTVTVPTWSDYYPLGIFDLTAGDDYFVNLSGVNANKVNADSIMIINDGVNPYDSAISINSGATYTNSPNVSLSLSAKDNLAVVLVQISETSPIPASTTLEDYQATRSFVLSPGDGLKTVYAQYFDIVLNVSTVVSDSIILDTSVPAPTNVTASLAGNVITVDWDDVVDGGSGLSGYNIYSSSDGFTNKINPSLIPAGTSAFGDTIQSSGNYSYKIEAVDNAGNTSAKSASSNAITLNFLPAVTSLSAQPGNGEVQLAWEQVPGASGYLVRYFLASNPGNQLAAVFVAGNSTTISNLTNESVYRFEVQAVDSVSGMLGTPMAVTASPTAPIPPVVEAKVTLSAVPSVTTVSETAPPPTVTQIPPTTEQGKIKGEEVKQNETEKDAFNWTPWIILIVIIVLAGAATGGYFYWTRGEETPASQVTVTKRTSAPPKVSVNKKTPPTKKNRW